MKIQHMAPKAFFGRHTLAEASPKVHGALRTPDAEELPAELAAALAAGDRARALAKIDEWYGEALFRFIVAIVGKADRADDIYQVTLLEAFRDLDTFAERSSLRTWLFGIARHRCLDALKADRRREGRIESMVELPEVADAAPSAVERMGDAELAAALADCLDELAPEVRMVLMMRFQEGFGYEQLASICGSTAVAMRARVCRALPALRRCIDGKGEP